MSGFRTTEQRCALAAVNYEFEDDLAVVRDPSFDYDFTGLAAEPGEQYMRGTQIYKRPYGWKRYAIKVKDKYENNIWLGTSASIRQSSEPGEWWVAYHGTSNVGNFKEISSKGFQVGPRDMYGKGVYSTPDVEIACKAYGLQSIFKENGETKMAVLQVRVNPAGTKVVTDPHFGIYYVTENPKDIRLYGILVKKTDI